MNSTPLVGNFIFCGKPIFADDGITVVDWMGACVKVSEIKTLHLDNHIYENGKKGEGTIFYTYKDEWYVCELHIRVIVDYINKMLKTNPINKARIAKNGKITRKMDT